MADQAIGLTKTCSKCGEKKPFTADYFRRRSNDALELQCLSCWRAYCKDYYRKNRDKMLAGFRAARAADPEFHRERDRRYFAVNRDKKRDSKKRQWATCDREAHYEKVRAWKATNPEKARAIEERRNKRLRTDPELRAKATERVRRWAQANPEATAAQRARRRARDMGAEGSYTRQDVHAVLRLQKRRCYYCEERLKRFDVDHWIPLIRGGSNHPENIVVCCGSCNSSKGAKLPWEWKPERFSEGQLPR